MTAEDRLKNEDILNDMQHKLNYLRNPRNIPANVTNLLIRSPKQEIKKSQHTIVGTTNHSSKNNNKNSILPLNKISKSDINIPIKEPKDEIYKEEDQEYTTRVFAAYNATMQRQISGSVKAGPFHRSIDPTLEGRTLQVRGIESSRG